MVLVHTVIKWWWWRSTWPCIRLRTWGRRRIRWRMLLTIHVRLRLLQKSIWLEIWRWALIILFVMLISVMRRILWLLFTFLPWISFCLKFGATSSTESLYFALSWLLLAVSSAHTPMAFWGFFHLGLRSRRWLLLNLDYWVIRIILRHSLWLHLLIPSLSHGRIAPLHFDLHHLLHRRPRT
jgi:hypothetical protein